jgi:SAM-dependent methyltransferase
MSEAADHPAVRSHRQVVERLWTVPVLDLCADELPAPDGSTVLSAESRTGAVLLRWLKVLPSGTRVMALDSSGPMLDEARERIDESEHRRIFFVKQRINALSYADGVFDGVVCLHGMVSRRQAREGMSELWRVVAPGGRLVACFPLAGSFPEFYDMMEEALRALGLTNALGRMSDLKSNLLEENAVARLLDGAPAEVTYNELTWEVAFGSGREFLYSPLVQETFFPHWVGAIRASDREKVLRYIGDAIDTYWRDRTLDTSLQAALVVADKT